MPPNLQTHFDEWERLRAAVQSRASSLTDRQLCWSPDLETWSTVQIVQHLTLSDETVGRAHTPQSLPPDTLPFRLIPRAARRALVLRALARDTVLPLPSPDFAPAEAMPLPDLLARWQAARADMERALNTLRPGDALYSHPIIGPLTPLQMVQLGLAHTAYHLRQMETLQSHPAFPRTALP